MADAEVRRRTHQPVLLYFPSPTPRKFWIGEKGKRTGLQAPLAGPGETCSGTERTKTGHSPLLIFMSQKEILHLLPSEIQLIVIVTLHSLGLIHRVIQ